jgi:hypothetical protein
MTREKLKQSLMAVGYENDSIKSLLCGRAKPSFKKAQLLYSKYGVPFEAWIDIKQYLQNKRA